MSPNDLRLCFSPAFIKLSKTRASQVIGITMTLLGATSGFAVQSSTTSLSTPPDNSQVAVADSSASVAVPAGTRFALVLTQPIQTRYIHRGDDIYAQIVSPVTAGNEVVIPPGTFVQGKVDTIERRGGRGELHLQSMSITFPDGYTTPIAGPMTLESNDGYALKDPGKGRIVGSFALPAAGLGIGALIGHSVGGSPSTITSSLPPGCTGLPPACISSSMPGPSTTLRNTAIGSMVGFAVGGVASLALVLNTHNFFLDVGSPVEMILQHPISLQEDEVAAAIRDSEQHPAAEQPIAQRPRPTPTSTVDNSGPTFCETPGTPGTPDIDMPGTQAIGDSPGTPAIHIPGIPATPPTTHFCP
jgi:hypothetical protein